MYAFRRNMVQASGMYNTLLNSNRSCHHDRMPEWLSVKRKASRQSIGIYRSPGYTRGLRHGSDITIVSYGSTLRIAQNAADMLEAFDISCEIIDVQTLLPFDIHHKILESLKKNQPHHFHR
jgi:transketolase C-terminal domain/subunit